MVLSIGLGGIIKPGEFADILQSRQWIDVDPVVWSCNKQVLSAPFAPGLAVPQGQNQSRKKTGPHGVAAAQALHGGQGQVRGPQRGGAHSPHCGKEAGEERKLRRRAARQH